MDEQADDADEDARTDALPDPDRAEPARGDGVADTTTAQLTPADSDGAGSARSAEPDGEVEQDERAGGEVEQDERAGGEVEQDERAGGEVEQDERAGDEADGAGADAETPGWVRWGRRGRVVFFALAGAIVALGLVGRVKAEIGPFDATVSARPSFTSRTTVRLAPLGTIVLDTHDTPLALDLRADQIGLAEAKLIANHPEDVNRLGDDVAADVHDAVVRLAIRCTLVAVAGGTLGALAARASWRSGLAGAGAGMLMVGVVGGGSAATFNANAVAEPRYTGLLTAAPTAVGDVQSIIERYGEYRAQLSELVGNVVTLYLAAENLPTFQPDDDTIRVLHVSDIHLNPQAFDLMEQLIDQFGVDVVADTGDITDWGTEPEARLVEEIGRLDVPYVYVRGNHDSSRTQAAVADQPNAVVLDGEAATVAGLRFWGIGDPRYTPDKDQPTGVEHERETAEEFASTVAARLNVDEMGIDVPDIDVALVHDARAAADLGGRVPLVLSGHTHSADVTRIGDDDETLVLTEGSTGGAGLRGLQGDEPHPLTASVLYFDPDTNELIAYDEISVKGFGETGATIDRHILEPDDNGAGSADLDPEPVLNRRPRTGRS